jgi:hypothetical protein
MTAGADLRLVRAAVFTAVCVTLSAAGHSLTGGERMPLWSLGLAFAVVFAVAAPLAGRERSLPGIAALLAAGQIALHTLFSCERAAVGSGAASSAHAHAGTHGASHATGLREFAAALLCDEPPGGISESRARRIVSDAGFDADKLAGHAGHTGHSGMAQHAHHAGHAGHAGH